MLGLLFSIVAVMPSGPAGVVCEMEGPSCEAAQVAEAFATPAAIDCRVPVVSMVLQALVGECDGTARDASYRASRDPDSERSPGSLRPGRRGGRWDGRSDGRSDGRWDDRSLAACAGLPVERGDAGTPSSNQPVALFALPEPPRFQATRFSDGATFFVPCTELRLLERPPRA